MTHILAELRNDLDPKVTQEQAAEFFYMKRGDTIGNWENGWCCPQKRHHERFIIYLKDKLCLGSDKEKLHKIWKDIMVGEWEWDPLNEEEPPGRYSIEPPFLPRIVPLQRQPRDHYFKGRKVELKRLLDDLRPGQIVTLCGPGGVGKTALAIEAIWRLAPGDEPPSRFPDGIVFHDFYLHPQAVLALEHIARSFGEEPRPSSAAAAQRALSGRVALLLLDGAENADDLKAVLNVAGRCGVIVTSRRHEDALAEWQDIRPLSPAEALGLLQAWGQECVMDEVAAQHIVELVGRLPLAVKLIGRYLSETQEQVADYLVWLEKTPLDALNLEESIPLLLTRSLKQVSEAARQVLGVVGLLALAPLGRGVIMAGLGVESSQAGRWLGELVNYGLLLRQDDRYEVSHALIHTYSRKCLQPNANVMMRLVTHYTSLAETESKKKIESYLRLNRERSHIIRLLTLCVEQQEWQAVVNLVQAVDSYLIHQGHWTDRVFANKIGRAAAHKLSDWVYECIFMDNLGRTWDILGKENKAQTIFDEALGISSKIDNPVDKNRIKSRILDHRGSVYRHRRRIKRAIKDYRKALIIAKEINDRRGQDTSLCSLGRIYTEIGPVEWAIKYIEQALAIAFKLDDGRHRESIDLGYLGDAYIAKWKLWQASDDMKKAINCYENAWDLAKKAGDRRGEGKQLLSLGKAYNISGQREQAVEYIQAALSIAREIDDIRLERDCRATGLISK